MAQKVFERFNSNIEKAKQWPVIVSIGLVLTVAGGLWEIFTKSKEAWSLYGKWHNSQQYACAAEEERWRAWRALPRTDAAQRFKEMKNALERKSTSNSWDSNIRSLTHLVNEHSIIPGLHENLGAMYMENGDFSNAKKHLQDELIMVGCLEKDPAATKGMVLVDPAASDGLDSSQVLRRARAIAHYNLAGVHAQEGDPNEAFADLRLAIADGFPENRSELEGFERDRFLKPLRELPEYEPLVQRLRLTMGD